jgi:hypothetical protein
MKRTLVPAAFALTVSLFSACVDDQPKHPKNTGHQKPPSSNTEVLNGATPDDQPNPDNPPPTHPATPDTKPQQPVPEKPGTVGEIPYAKPVPGKPGFVFSPYEQYKGYIDVRGFPPGTEVKDPYSGKSFLVP